MGGFIRKVAVALILFFLLSCIAVSVAVRLSPRAAPFFLGGMGCFYLALLVLVLGIPSVRRRRRETEARALAQAEADREAPPKPDPAEEARRLLALDYVRTLERLDLPAEAGQVQMQSGLFAPASVNMLHYCWTAGEELVLFPRWDGIESHLALLDFVGRDSWHLLRLDPVRVPLQSIEYYALLTPAPQGEGLVMLRYRGNLGESVGLLFQEDALELLRELLPEQDLEYQQQKRYPSSAQQIQDIRDKMRKLKELHEQELIEEEEYRAKRAQFLTQL